MKEILNQELFNKNIRSLKDISLDKSNDQYMVKLPNKAIDFDNFKKDYCRKINSHQNNTSSADALFYHQDKLLMVEFKNGQLAKMRHSDLEMMLKNKMLHSLLMFCDVTGTTISFTRKNLVFILVYNEEKNKIFKNKIRKHISSKAKTHIVRFGLDKFPEFFYNDVQTLTAEQFVSYINRKR